MASFGMHPSSGRCWAEGRAVHLMPVGSLPSQQSLMKSEGNVGLCELCAALQVEQSASLVTRLTRLNSFANRRHEDCLDGLTHGHRPCQSKSRPFSSLCHQRPASRAGRAPQLTPKTSEVCGGDSAPEGENSGGCQVSAAFACLSSRRLATQGIWVPLFVPASAIRAGQLAKW